MRSVTRLMRLLRSMSGCRRQTFPFKCLHQLKVRGCRKRNKTSGARTANVFARVEPELKEQAESVLDQLGIPMSNAVGMFLRQIVLQKGIHLK